MAGGRVFVATERDTVYALVVLHRRGGLVVPPGHAGPGLRPPLRQHRTHRGDHRHAGHRRSPGRALRGGRRAGARSARPRAGGPRHRHRRHRADPDVSIPPGRIPPPCSSGPGSPSPRGGWSSASAATTGTARPTGAGWWASDEAGGTPVDFGVDTGRGQSQGAVWMGGAAPAVDADGQRVGRRGQRVGRPRPPSPTTTATRCSSSTRRCSSCSSSPPPRGPSDNASDLDLSMAPALLPDGQVVIAGKAGIAYLLDGARLGRHRRPAGLAGLGLPRRRGRGQRRGGERRLPALSERHRGRPGRDAPRPRCGRCGAPATGGGPPIVAAGLVWTIGQDGTLSGLDPATGSVRQQASIGRPGQPLPDPERRRRAVGGGLRRPGGGVHRLAGASATSPTTTGPVTTAPAPRPTGAGRRRTLPTGAVAGIAGVAVGVLGGVGWLLWRRRPRRGGRGM